MGQIANLDRCFKFYTLSVQDLTNPFPLLLNPPPNTITPPMVLILGGF